MTSITDPSSLPSPSPSPAPDRLQTMQPLRQSDAEPAAGAWFWIAAAVTLLLAIVPAVLWPGDVTWIDDEPGLVLNALIANADHTLAAHGLFGSFPVPYGPLPTQFYQLCLLFTHNLQVVVVVRAGLSAAVFAGSLLWLARTLRMTPWLAAAAVLGPYLWNYQRVLWDCSLLIPVSTLAVAAYAAFLRRRSGASLVTALTAATFAPLIHLQAIPLFAVIVGHAVWRYRPELRKYRKRLIAAGIFVFCLNAGYFLWLTADVTKNFVHIIWFGHSDHRPIREALSGPLLGGRMLAAVEYLKSLPPLHAPAGLVSVAMLVSEIILPLIWLGIIICAVLEYRRYSSRRIAPVEEPPRNPTVDSTRDTLAAMALVSLGLQLLMVAALRIPPWVHYCFGNLPFFLLFAWFAVEFLQRIRIGLPLVAAWGASLAFLTFTADWQIHREGYPRGCNSPLLANQMQVADALSHYGDLLVWTDVPNYQSYPAALQVLRMLATHNPAALVSHGPLLVRFAPDPAGRSSRIELIQLRSRSDLPPKAKRLDLGPPTNWQ